MVIEVCNLTKKYKAKNALIDFSLKFPSNKISALLGPNGSGKTTLMRIIMGYITPTSGTVYINGINILDNPYYARKNIGYLPENNPLYTDMYVYEYLHFIGSIKKTQNLRKRIKEVLEIVGLEEYVKFKIGTLSKGYKQRVGLAAALINDPPILILDEPTSGLDPIQVLGIRNLIKSMSGNKTIIFSTHILPEAEKIADFIVIMHKGRLLAAESSSELSSLPVNSKIMVVEWASPPPQLPKNLNVYKISNTVWEITFQEDPPEKEILEISKKWNIPITSSHYKESPLEAFFREIVLTE